MSPTDRSTRPFDVVLYGATGFTGQLCAEYLARDVKLPAKRWALAGRNTTKLARVRDDLARIDPSYGELELIEASAEAPSSLVDAASRARALITTVGPYARHGEPCADACVEAGTHYADITGEPAFVGKLIEKHDRAARDKGLRLVPCCGFDSIPHDMGAYFTAKQLASYEGPMVIEGFVRSKGDFSGGTWQSAVNAFGNARSASADARAMRTDPGPGRRVRPVPPKIRYEKALSSWVCPLPTIDPQIVLRSAALMPEVFGEDFSYGHYLRVRSAVYLGAGLAAVGVMVGLAQTKPTRELLAKLRPSGEGPSAVKRARHWFEVTMLGRRAGHQVTAIISGGDPGYTETSKMLCESALCLALDEEKLPARGGVLTTASAMGDVLLDRLTRAGIGFEVRAGA